MFKHYDFSHLWFSIYFHSLSRFLLPPISLINIYLLSSNKSTIVLCNNTREWRVKFIISFLHSSLSRASLFAPEQILCFSTIFHSSSGFFCRLYRALPLKMAPVIFEKEKRKRSRKSLLGNDRIAVKVPFNRVDAFLSISPLLFLVDLFQSSRSTTSSSLLLSPLSLSLPLSLLFFLLSSFESFIFTVSS